MVSRSFGAVATAGLAALAHAVPAAFAIAAAALVVAIAAAALVLADAAAALILADAAAAAGLHLHLHEHSLPEDGGPGGQR